MKWMLLLVMVISLAAGWAAGIWGADDSSAKEYVCLPCDLVCDLDVHDKPGTCSYCSMPLVEKASLKLDPARAYMPLIQEVAARKIKVAILIFEGVQIIDYTGPYEVFGQAGFRVFTVAEKPGPITTAMGMSVNPAYTFGDHPEPDILLLPGGNVPDQPAPEVIQWIQDNAQRARVVLSVCNGAFYLANAGLLDGLEATTFAGLINALQEAAPKTKVVSNKRFVDNGKIITSAGLSSGIDGSLHVVEKLLGRSWAQIVATNMEYNWDPDSSYVRAALADRNLRGVFRFMRRYEREVASFGGATDRWTSKWNVSTDLSAEKFLDSMNNHLLLVEKWVRQDTKVSTGSAWKFSGADGKEWSGEAKVEPVAGRTGKITVSIQIARS